MFIRPSMIAVIATLTIASIGLAHTDDPKVLDKQPPYEGPGYRRGTEGSRGVGPRLDFPAENMHLRSWITIPEFPGTHNGANDCWGYVSGSGREYAIIGLSQGTAFVEVTDPGDPIIIGVIAGPTSIWRDIKVYQNYAYAVSEGGQGIQVIDMSAIDSGTVSFLGTVLTGGVFATHNVAINEDSGYLYRCGGSSNGLRIYDLTTNPASPTFVTSWTDRYVHDAQIVSYTEGPYAGREIAFCCGGFNGGWVDTGLIILDVTDKQNIMELSVATYGNAAYSHQGWLSPDRHYFYLDDEIDERDGLNPVTTTRIIDVSDLENPGLAGTFTSGSTSIDHNLYTLGNLIFEANYRSGIRVFDATDPVNPTQIAFFDTYPDNDAANFNGLWSNYPYFPSGTIIGSDLEKGLFVWRLGPEPLFAPVTAPAPHDRAKNRYVSFDVGLQPREVALQLELVELELGSCSGNGARCRLDHGDADCGLCSISGEPCRQPSDCNVVGGETCEPSGDTCVNDQFGSVGQSWWVGPPGENGISRLVSEPFRHFSDDWGSVVQVGDCEVVPHASFAVRAYDGTDFSDALIVKTAERPGTKYWADAVGPFGTFCDGDPSRSACDPDNNLCSPGALCLGAWQMPDGAINFDDIGAAVRLFQSPPGAVLPDVTWIDLHGDDAGPAATQPPNLVANFSDVQFMVLAFEGAPYPFADPALCPDVGP